MAPWLFFLLIAGGFWFIARVVVRTANHHWALEAKREETPDTLHPVASRATLRCTYEEWQQTSGEARRLEQEFLAGEGELWRGGVPASASASRQMSDVASTTVRAQNLERRFELMLSLNSRVFRGEISRTEGIELLSKARSFVFDDVARSDDIVADWKKRLRVGPQMVAASNER